MKGISVFRNYFQDFQDQYVLIGGAACDLIFEAQDTAFRATKDLDIVLLVEALTPDFGRKFWDFIKAGGYEHRAKSSGTPQFYRFDRPTQCRHGVSAPRVPEEYQRCMQYRRTRCAADRNSASVFR